MSENNQLRDVFDAIADPTRRRLIHLLAGAEEIPLHELTAQFQMGRTAVSKHRLTFISIKPDSQMLKESKELDMAGANGAASLKR